MNDRSPTSAIGFIAIARPTFDVPFAQERAALGYQMCAALGLPLVGDDTLIMDAEAAAARIDHLRQAAPAAVIALQASFADSSLVVELARQIDAPLLLWGLPEPRTGGRLRLNSFCGINLAAHGLRRAGLRWEYVYGDPESEATVRTLRAFVGAADVRRRLHNARIGRIGEHPAGFDSCRYDEAALRERLGVMVEPVALQTVFAGVRAADPAQVAALTESLSRRIDGLEAVDQTATAGTLGVYTTLRGLANREHLDGLAVRCWPEFFTDLGCAACGALSLLSDGQTPTSCEADVNGTITQLILQWLSGEPAFGSDLVAFDTEEDVTVLWHCGLAPLSMADPNVQPQAAIHSNRKLPLLMQFPLKPGRVTLARLSEATGSYRLVIGTGEMIAAPPSFSGTCGTLRFDSGTQAAMDTLLREGLEHHISLVYGDHAEALAMLARMLDLPVLRI